MITRRHVTAGLAVGIPASGLFLFLAARNVDTATVAATLRGADPRRVLLAVALIGVMYALQAQRWQRIAARDARLPARRFLRYVVGGLACNNVVPGRVGDLLRAEWLAKGTGISRTRAVATVVVDRASDLLALVGLLLITLPVAPRPSWLGRIDLVAAVGGLALVVLLLAARRHARRRTDTEARSRIGRIISDGLTTMSGAVNRRDAPAVAALSFGAWGAWAVSAWLVASSLGVSLSVPEVLFVAAVINLGVAIPSSPGFVGTYQWLCVSTLGLLSVGHAEAFAFSVLMHAVWYVPTTVAGLMLALLHGRSVGLAAIRARPQTAPSA